VLRRPLNAADAGDALLKLFIDCAPELAKPLAKVRL
jgi:hypothetical protein